MVLTHVYEIKGGSWKHVTPPQMTQKYHRTIRINEKMLICSLCGSYVLLTDGNKQSNHFRHDHQDIKHTKHCPERSDSSQEHVYKVSYRKIETPFLLKMNAAKKTLRFQVGILGIPRKTLEQKTRNKQKVTIKNTQGKVVATKDYAELDPYQTTFIDVGSEIEDEYLIGRGKQDNRQRTLKDLIPTGVSGVNASGFSLFEAAGGEKIPEWGSLQANQVYYLLSKSPIVGKSNLVRNLLFKHHGWFCYQVKINEVTPDLIQYFIEEHYFLENNPIDIFPVWPPSISEKQQIFTKKGVNLYVQAEDDIEVSANNTKNLYQVKPSEANGWRLLNELSGQSRIKKVAAGRNNIAKHAIIRNIDQEYQSSRFLAPEVKVTSQDGIVLTENKYEKLPTNGILCFLPRFNGKVCVFKGKTLVGVKNLLAKKQKTVPVHFGEQVKIYQGQDLIREISFENGGKPVEDQQEQQVEHGEEQNLDQSFLKQLKGYKGSEMFISHSVGAMAEKMKGYPLCQKWFRITVRNNVIDSRALKLLQRKFV